MVSHEPHSKTVKPKAPLKQVRQDESGEHSASDTTLKPSEPKRARQDDVRTGDHSTDDTIDVTMYYICFGSYEDDVREGTGSEWRECVCGCWVRNDCIIDVVVEASGKERLCPVCIT